MISLKSFSVWLLLAALLVIWPSCQKWDLQKTTFLEVNTLEAYGDSPTSIVVQSEVTGLTANAIIDQYGVVFSYTNPEPNIQEDYFFDQGQRSQDGDFQTIIQGLAVDLPIYLRAVASADGKLVYGNVLTATPEQIGLEIRMDSVVITNTAVNLFGYIKGSPDVSFEGHGFVWSTERQEPNVFEDDGWFIGPVNTEEAIMEGELPDMDPLEVYYVRAFVYSGLEVIYSPEVLMVTRGNAWRNLGAFPVALDFSSVYYSFSIEGDHYVGFPDKFGIYDPVENSWEEKANNHPLSYTTSVISSIGQEAVFRFSDNNFKYTATTDDWLPIDNFPIQQELESPVGFKVGGEGYFATGIKGTEFYRETFRYLPGTQSWEYVGDFPGTEIHNRATFEFADRACLTRGFFYPFYDCWCFTEAGNWIQMADFPLDVTPYANVYSFTIGDKGYVILPDDVDNFWEYDLQTDTWTQRADFPGGARNDALAFSKDGRGYFGMGFKSLSFQSSFEMWEYIPAPE